MRTKAKRKRGRLCKGTQRKLWKSPCSRHSYLFFSANDVFSRFFSWDAPSSTLLYHYYRTFWGPKIQVVQSESLLKGRYRVTIENCLRASGAVAFHGPFSRHAWKIVEIIDLTSWPRGLTVNMRRVSSLFPLVSRFADGTIEQVASLEMEWHSSSECWLLRFQLHKNKVRQGIGKTRLRLKSLQKVAAFKFEDTFDERIDIPNWNSLKLHAVRKPKLTLYRAALSCLAGAMVGCLQLALQDLATRTWGWDESRGCSRTSSTLVYQCHTRIGISFASVIKRGMNIFRNWLGLP